MLQNKPLLMDTQAFGSVFSCLTRFYTRVRATIPQLKVYKVSHHLDFVMAGRALPRETRLRMADLASHRDRKGITGMSENTIRRLIKTGDFPQPHEIEGVTGKFFVYGEVVDWLEKQRQGKGAAA